ncbi:sugar ABC transporter permease [Chloroflexi bacterium TSY]|nr:sugar ABC transporter permease [Chloroflexi bacterium TSY]
MKNTLREMRRRWYCYAMMSGTIILLITFAYYPAFSAFYHSFTLWDGYRPARWAGVQNYAEVLSRPIYWTAFQNMILLSIWMVVRAATFPLLAAALIYRLRSERWAYFFRLLFVLPLVVPSVVAILIWRQPYEPNFGLFNEILGLMGMEPLGWLNDPSTALASLMFVGFPWIDGVGMLIYLAGLLAIPNSVEYEAV